MKFKIERWHNEHSRRDEFRVVGKQNGNRLYGPLASDEESAVQGFRRMMQDIVADLGIFAVATRTSA